MLDKLLSGRAWIGLVFVLLAGIVFFNVDLLQMNREIARNADRAAAVKAENARLRTDLARLGSSERIQQVAAQAGLVLPAPGEVRYLRAAPATDAKRAAKRIDRGKASAPPVAPVVPPAAGPRSGRGARRSGGRDARRPAGRAPWPAEPRRSHSPNPRGLRWVQPVGLVNRRIGLLFALFLLLLGFASMRAAWLGTVRADSLKERAMTQQVEDLDVPALRGTITDRRGVELAVSEDAATVFANPFLIDDPAGTAETLAPLVGRTSEQLLPLLSDRKKGFTYLRRKMDPGLGEEGG